MAGFKETWDSIPFVTRHAGALALFMYILFCLNPYYAVFGWNYQGAPRYEVWRYVLSVFSYQGSILQGCFEVIGLCMSLNVLEASFWKSRGQAAYYLAFVGLVLNLAGPKLGMFAFLPELNMALSWTLAQESPFSKTTFLIIDIEQRYSPWAQLAIRVLLGGFNAAIGPMLGIFAAHLFLFLTEHLPRSGGPRFFSQPPRLFKYLDTMEENKRKEMQYGRSRRLGT